MDETLLKPGAAIDIRRAVETFVTKDRFVLNVESPEKILISVILGDFLKWFADKRETPLSESTVRYYELQRNAGDQTILAELGGEAKAETTLAEVFWLLDRQKQGEAGILAVNGWGNIFYVRDAADVLRAVYVHWCDEAWNVEASRIGRPAEWPIRDRVFVRGSGNG